MFLQSEKNYKVKSRNTIIRQLLVILLQTENHKFTEVTTQVFCPLDRNGSYSEIMLRAEKSVYFSVSCTHIRMVVRCVLCLTLILMGLSQIEAHELYLSNKKIKTKFRKVEVSRHPRVY